MVLYLLFKGHTPLHLAAWKGKTEVVDLLLMSGASLSVMNNEVIKPSVKLRHSNIKLFKYRVILLLKQKMLRVL
jgi:ankyrin repeat protein